MATREENLKKINDELEKMSDAELDKIADGFYYAEYPMTHEQNPKPAPNKKHAPNPANAGYFSGPL